jgi:curved DNA-binding protein CbpA
MTETFYSVLGVEPGVDGEAVERAYRERVKEVHPDVADDPDAPREFARLTVARDVLVDDEKRGRYDDLGHAAYVRAHVNASVWAAEDDATDADASGADADGTDTGGTDAAAASTRTTTEPDAAEPTASGTTADRRRRGRRQRGTAAAYHRVGSEDVVGRERDPLWRRVVAVGRRVGPWALVHLVLVASAAATAWFGYAGAAHLDMSLPALAVAVVVLVVTLLASAAHLLLRVYA